MRSIEPVVCGLRQHTTRPGLLCVFVALQLLTAPAANAQVIIDLAAATRATDTIRGPVTIRLINVNRFRYNVAIGRRVVELPLDLAVPAQLRRPTFGEGPASSAGERRIAPSGETTVPDTIAILQDTAFLRTVGQPYQNMVALLDTLRTATNPLQEVIASITIDVNHSNLMLSRLLRTSDDILAVGGPDALLANIELLYEEQVAILTTVSGFRDGLSRFGAVLSNAELSLRDLQAVMEDQWPELFRGLRDGIQAVHDKYRNAEQFAHSLQMDQMARWNTLLGTLVSVGREAFTHIESIKCNSSFAGGAYVTLTISQADRGAPQMESGQPADTVTDSQPVVTVRCPPRFHVSAGWLATRVDIVEYGAMAVPREGVNDDPSVTTVNRVILVRESKNKQSPILMVTGRLWNWSLWGSPLGMHLAVGTLVDIGGKDQSEDIVKLLGGSLGSEFVVGGSLSLADILFFSPVVHFVETSTLSPEVQLGMPLPAGVSEVPLVRHVKSRFGLAATLRFPLG